MISKFASLKNSFRWVYLTIRIFRNWRHIYSLRFSKSRPDTIQLELRNGIVFEVKDKNATVPIITEIWHDRVYGNIKELAGETSPLIIDIGGNIGAFSLFALYTLPASKVYVFEPEPQNFRCLEKNIALNAMGPRCTLVNKAVCGTRGERTLSLTGVNSAKNSMFATNPVSSKIKVSCMTLEDIFSEFTIPWCSLLKIDCEGAEYEILMNTPQDIFKRIKRIILEWHDVEGYTPQALVLFLQSMGYTAILDYPVRNIMTLVRK